MLYIVPCNVLKDGKLTLIFDPQIPKSAKIAEIMANCHVFRQLKKSSHNVILLPPFHLMLTKYDLISSYCVKNRYLYTLYHIHKPQKSNTGATWSTGILYLGAS